MSMTQLLFDDEGKISRRQWWLGSGMLFALYMVLGIGMGRWLQGSGLDRPIMLFFSIAILIPFYAINAKRFRAMGRSPGLALWGGIVPCLSILIGTFLKAPWLDILLGWMMIGITIWYVIDLGVYAHGFSAYLARIDAAAKRN